MPNKNNIQATKELIEKYRIITLEDIKDVEVSTIGFTSVHIAERLTGFGSTLRCTLCQAVKGCSDCIHNVGTLSSIAFDGYRASLCITKTYYSIVESETPEELLYAFGERADYLSSLLSDLGIPQTHLEEITKEYTDSTKMMIFEIEVYSIEDEENHWINCGIHIEDGKLYEDYYYNEVTIDNDLFTLDGYLEALYDKVINSVIGDELLTLRGM